MMTRNEDKLVELEGFGLGCSRQALELYLSSHFEVPGRPGSLLGTEFEDRGQATVVISLLGRGRLELRTKTIASEEIYIEPVVRAADDDTELEAEANDTLSAIKQRFPLIGKWPPEPGRNPRQTTIAGERDEIFDEWFDWYEECKKRGLPVSLRILADRTHYSYGHVRNERMRYLDS